MSTDNDFYVAGATFTYRSVTTYEMVTWTRDDHGLWHASDGREGAATDADVAFNSTHNPRSGLL